MLCHKCREFLRLDRRHRAHVRDDRALCRAREHAIRTAENRAHNRTVRHHGNHDVRARRRLLCRPRRIRPLRSHHLYGLCHHVKDRDRKARLHEIAYHRLAHNPETDKTDVLHHQFLPFM